jgi:Lipid A core - O-antigen ligase and related enzymes
MLRVLLGTVVLWFTVYSLDAWQGYPFASDYAAKTGEGFGLHLFNRPLTFCALLLVPVMFWPGIHIILRWAIALGVAAILFTSICETAMVSFAVTLVGVLMVLKLPRAERFLRAVVVMAAVLVVGLPSLSRHLPVESPDFMSALRYTSFQHRLFYWDNASRLTLEAPLLGYGGEASRYFSEIPDPRPQKAYVNGEAVYSMDGKLVGLHPHNGVIQLWLEYGALGALFLLAGLWCWYRYWVDAPDRRTQAARFALFSAVFVAMNAAWGAWQTDWVAVIILTIVFNTRLEDAVTGAQADQKT